MDKPQYVIINTVDRPEPRMVCELVGGHYYYMSRSLDKRLMEYKMQGANPTPLEDFGFGCMRHEYQTDFIKFGASKAKYKDGTTREWQSDRIIFSLPNVVLENEDD